MTNQKSRNKSKKAAAPKKTRKQRANRSAVHTGVAGGLDFIGAVICVLLIILLLFMLVALISWFRRDTRVLFSDLGTSITDALLIHGGP